MKTNKVYKMILVLVLAALMLISLAGCGETTVSKYYVGNVYAFSNILDADKLVKLEYQTNASGSKLQLVSSTLNSVKAAEADRQYCYSESAQSFYYYIPTTVNGEALVYSYYNALLKNENVTAKQSPYESRQGYFTVTVKTSGGSFNLTCVNSGSWVRVTVQSK